jgi:hypothetical protein
MNNKVLFFLTKRVTSAFCLKRRHNLVTKHPLNHPNKDLEKLKVKKNNNHTDLIILVRKNNHY